MTSPSFAMDFDKFLKIAHQPALSFIVVVLLDPLKRFRGAVEFHAWPGKSLLPSSRVALQGLDQRSKTEEWPKLACYQRGLYAFREGSAQTSHNLNVLGHPLPSSKWWIKMMRQLSKFLVFSQQDCQFSIPFREW